MASNDPDFLEAVEGLKRGDFTRLDPLFVPRADHPARIMAWCDLGYFDTEPEALAEALSCACFNGRTDVAHFLMDKRVAPEGGAGTGMNALHWAANRGQVEAVRLLVDRKAPLEAENAYGGTVLGATVWAAINEPKPGQLEVLHLLLQAGAKVDRAGYPTGNEAVDEVFKRHGAGTY